MSQSYTKSTAPTVETAAQTETQSFNTGLSAARQLNSKMSLDLGLSQSITLASDGYNSFKTWSTTDFLDYQFWPAFNGGVGATLGYTDVDQGNDMTFEQPTLRLSYRPMDKTSFDLHGGLEFRQMMGGGADNLLTPVYGASINYAPFDSTMLSLSANRSVSPSYFNNQITEGTSVSLSLNQRILKRLNLGLSGGLSITDYVETSKDLNTARNDDRYFFNARLSTAFLKRATFGVFYNYQKNNSDVENYAYDSNMIGADVSYRW